MELAAHWHRCQILQKTSEYFHQILHREKRACQVRLSAEELGSNLRVNFPGARRFLSLFEVWCFGCSRIHVDYQLQNHFRLKELFTTPPETRVKAEQQEESERASQAVRRPYGRGSFVSWP